MTNEQIKRCRANEIRFMARMLDGDNELAERLYKRCVRFMLRYGRWSTVDVSENLTGYQLEMHEHEGDLLRNLERILNDELGRYGLHFEHNGLYPTLYTNDGNHGPWLITYGNLS